MDAAGSGPDVELERRILAAVRGLLTDLGGAGLASGVDLRSRLEEDLGIYSLERLELLLRVEQACGHTLGDAALHAATVHDLAHAVNGRIGPSSSPGAALARETRRGTTVLAGSLVFTAYAGGLLVLIGTVVLPMLRIVPAGARTVRLLQRGAAALFRAAGCRIALRGAQHLTGALPAVIVANHESYVDALVLLAALPLVPNVIVNERLPGAPLVGRFVRAARFLAVDRTSVTDRLACATGMTQALSAGESLVVFPEATFGDGPGMLPFRLGAFSAAVAAGRPVVPVTLRGTREMLPAGARLLRRSRLSVVIHPPLYPRGTGWLEAVRLRDEARTLITPATNPGG